MNFKGKKVVVFGLGVLGGGVGTAEFFAKNGAEVLVTDLRQKANFKESLKKLSKYKIKYILGKHRKEDFTNADLIIKNPSIPSNSPFLKIARKNNVEIEMAESLFIKLSPTKDIIGITGTRGKSTTSALIYKILKNAGFDAYLAGNFKNTSTLSLLEKIDKNSKIVLELSSWQLESFGWHKISPHISVITNIYPDHLNRYSSMKEYVNDKKNIFKFQKKEDCLILSKKNNYCQAFVKESKSKIIWFSKNDIKKSLKTNLLGEHNLENMAAALKIAKIYKVDETVVRKVFSSFSTLPFRLQKVGEINGVEIINDSTSTTPTSLVKALNSFPGKRIILICGGNSKNLSTKDMLDQIKKRTKTVLFIKGSGTEEIVKELKKDLDDVYSDLQKVLEKALSLSEKNDIILFSPGFTSFAMFKNEFERGEKFNHAVKTLLKKEKTSS